MVTLFVLTLKQKPDEKTFLFYNDNIFIADIAGPDNITHSIEY
jgi:hypothetical protein